MEIEHAIKHFEEMVKEELEEIQECLAVNEMENAMECENRALDYAKFAEWLRQLQKIQKIVKEYYYTPTEVMDCSDAFDMIREVVEEKK